MTIYNLGSINADFIYQLSHIPAAGETIASKSLDKGLGGKGANMSVAAARAGAHVVHIGAIGTDGRWAQDRLTEYGVDTRFITECDMPTGHAIIQLDAIGENAIILFAGANHSISENHIRNALSQAQAGDMFLTQNETNAQIFAAKIAQERGLRVAYAAAPFEPSSVLPMIDYLDFLILNEIEAAQLTAAVGQPPEALGIADVIVTKGGDGCDWYHEGTCKSFGAHRVNVVDTTGAGDTFTGYVLAALDRKLSMAQAITLATRAAAIKVTRIGAADAIPDLAEVESITFD